MQPGNHEPDRRFRSGQEVEIVLQTGPGQTVVSDDAGDPHARDTESSMPDRHAVRCPRHGRRGPSTRRMHGVGYLKISFGRHCSPTTGACDSIHIVLLKPFAVYSRPQAQ